MKKQLLFILILASHFSLLAYSLAPWLSVPAKAHLTEVNAQWECQVDLPTGLLNFPIAFSSDNERIAFHLQMVADVLENADTKHLNAQQLANRQRLIQTLKVYTKAGAFPENHYQDQRQPFFVDDAGTHCAVGYLMAQDGASNAVASVKNDFNEGYLHELAPLFPAIPEWAKENGFTLDELALIQPGYPPAGRDWNVVGNGGGYDGEILAMETMNDDLLILAGVFSEIDGFAANNIVAWNGENWSTLGQGLNGKVYDLVYVEQEQLIAVGEFSLFGNPEQKNVALWTGEEWIGLHEGGNMEGAIYTAHKQGNYGPIFIGGEFTMDDGNISYKNLATINYAWGAGQWRLQNYTQIFSIDGPVYDITQGFDQILIAGEFSLTAPESVDAEDMLAVNNIAYWDNNLSVWNNSLSTELEVVRSAHIKDGYVYLGDDAGQVDVLAAGLWHQVEGIYGWGEEDPAPVYGFVDFMDQLFAFGQISFSPLLGNFGYGLIPIYGEYAGGITYFDDNIKSAAFFQEHLYVAGDFTSADNQALPGLAATSFQVNAIGDPLEDDAVKIWAHGQSVYANTQALNTAGQLDIYNAQGQMLKTIQIEANTPWLEIPLDYRGIVFCRFQADELSKSQQLVLME